MAADIIPVANPLAQFAAHEAEIRNAIDRVLKSGWYILGSEVKLFEQEFAAFQGSDFCVSTASGTDAIVVALLASGIKPGDEVITVSHSAVATVAAIEQIGAIPVFSDIDPSTRCLDPRNIAPLVSPKTRAIIPVHIYGQPAPMPEIIAIAAEFALLVIEDCAQAHGAEIDGRKVGTFGDAAAFSFYPTKNLGAIGDGGAVVTSDEKIAANCRYLRQYGWKERYISFFPGVNSRLDELQASILRVKLPSLPANNARRREIARKYCAAIDRTGIVPPPLIANTLHAMHLFVVECANRDNLQQFLTDHGIATARHFPMPIHEQPAYKGRIRGADALPATETLYERIISLPMYPELTDSQVDKVCTTLKSFDSCRIS